jgi:hypothetical protein
VQIIHSPSIRSKVRRRATSPIENCASTYIYISNLFYETYSNVPRYPIGTCHVTIGTCHVTNGFFGVWSHSWPIPLLLLSPLSPFFPSTPSRAQNLPFLFFLPPASHRLLLRHSLISSAPLSISDDDQVYIFTPSYLLKILYFKCFLEYVFFFLNVCCNIWHFFAF